MSMAIKKILYAVDAKVSALGEAQEIITKSGDDADADADALDVHDWWLTTYDRWLNRTNGASSPWRGRQFEM